MLITIFHCVKFNYFVSLFLYHTIENIYIYIHCGILENCESPQNWTYWAQYWPSRTHAYIYLYIKHVTQVWLYTLHSIASCCLATGGKGLSTKIISRKGFVNLPSNCEKSVKNFRSKIQKLFRMFSNILMKTQLNVIFSFLFFYKRTESHLEA